MNRITFESPPGGGTQAQDGHTLVFLAHSGQKMPCNGLTVNLASMRVPLMGGEVKPVSELTDTDMLAVGLFIDHMPSVHHQVGHIERLELTEEGLVATARLADTDAGKEIMQLAAAGSLRNSFSISIEYEHADQMGVISNSQLTEISVVWAGADPRAKLIDIYSREKGITVNGSIGKKFGLTTKEADALVAAITTALQEGLASIREEVTKLREEPEESPDGGDEPEPEEPPAPEQTVSNSKPKGDSGMFLMQPTNASQVYTSPRTGWLDSKDAYVAFEKALLRSDGHGVQSFKKTWASEVKNHLALASSITEDDVASMIPTPVITEIQDVYNTADPLWPLLNKMGMDQYTVGANSNSLLAEDGSGRAHGYPVSSYGTEKSDQTVTLAKRTISADYIYKKVTLNKGDIRRTQRPGALLTYVLRELGNRIFQTIGRSVIFNGWEDMSMFRSLQADAADSTGGDEYCLTVTEGTESNLLFDFIRASLKVRAIGEKILVCNSSTLAALKISTNDNGTPLLSLTGGGLENALSVSQIITPPWWVDSDDETLLGAFLVPARYGVVGDTSIEAFTDFSLQTNENLFLQEIFAGGGLIEREAACLVTAGESSGS